MSRVILLFYIVVVFYITINAASELIFNKGFLFDKVTHAMSKMLFAWIWPICIFSDQGRDFLFNWTKHSNL